MAQATEAHTSIELTKKGERAAAAQAEARSLAIAEKRRIYREASNEIDKLLALVDRLAGDPDLEPSGDENDDDRQEEPSAGWTDMEARYGRYADDWLAGEGEQDDTDKEDGGELEPSVGGPGWDGGRNVDYAIHGKADDLERDDAELSGIADEDALSEAQGEPSLGATEAFSHDEAWQRGRYHTASVDREDQAEPTKAQRKRLRARRKAGKTVENIRVTSTSWTGRMRLSRADGSPI